MKMKSEWNSVFIKWTEVQLLFIDTINSGFLQGIMYENVNFD